jgi:hypothetical protein
VCFGLTNQTMDAKPAIKHSESAHFWRRCGTVNDRRAREIRERPLFTNLTRIIGIGKESQRCIVEPIAVLAAMKGHRHIRGSDHDCATVTAGKRPWARRRKMNQTTIPNSVLRKPMAHACSDRASRVLCSKFEGLRPSKRSAPPSQSAASPSASRRTPIGTSPSPMTPSSISSAIKSKTCSDGGASTPDTTAAPTPTCR